MEKRRACANNLVKALRLLLCDLCPALSVTLEGFQSWVIKEATQASGWERIYGCLELHLKLPGGGGDGSFFLPISIALCVLFKLGQESSMSKLHS